MEEMHATLARTQATLVRLAKRKAGNTSFSTEGSDAARRAAGQVGNVIGRPPAAPIGKGKAKGVVPTERLIDPAAATAYRKPPTKRPYVLPEALATAGAPPAAVAVERHNADLDEAFADPAPTVHPWLEGTRVGHHLQELARHEHGAIADAARAVLAQTDPKAAAQLGKLLKGSGHRLEDAYNWGTVQRNLEGDQRLHAHLTAAGLSRGITAEQFARNIEKRGTAHTALAALAKIHGTNPNEVLRAVSRIVDRYADKRELAAPLRHNADLDDAFGMGDGATYHDPHDYLGWTSNDEHARLSKLGTLAHGVAAGVAAAVGHGVGGMTGLENAEYPGAAMGLYAGLGRLGTLARGGVEALMAHIAKRRAARGGKLSPRIEALIAQVQEKKPLPDHGPTPARSRVSFVRALRESHLDPRLSHDPDLLRVWHLNAGHLGIDGEGALNAAARVAGIGHMRAHGYLPLPPDRPVSTTPARVNANAPPGKPQGEYRRYASAPRVTPGDLFAGFDAGPPPESRTKPTATRKKKVKRPPGPNLFDQV